MQKGSLREAGQIVIWIIVGSLIITVAGGAYYFNRSRSQICLQAFTTGRNILTGECRTFPTSCMPMHWIIDNCWAKNPNPVTSQTPQPTPAPLDEALKSQIYTDGDVGFTFEYTINWEKKDWEESQIAGFGSGGIPILSVTELHPRPPRLSTGDDLYDSIRIIIYKNINNLTVDEFVKKEAFKKEIGHPHFDYGNYKRGVPYEFNGLNGIRVDKVLTPPGGRGDSVFIPKNNYIIEISAISTSESNEKMLNQILSTFKFL